jgi:hypothetical protein
MLDHVQSAAVHCVSAATRLKLCTQRSICGGSQETSQLCIACLPIVSCVCPSFWEDYYMLIYTHCWELMNSVGSHGSSSLLFVMKVMVCHFVSDSHEVMTALIVVLPLLVVVEISLQLHRSCFLCLIEMFQ